MTFWRRWAAERAERARAEAFVAALGVEPAAEDVAWLAASATDGDLDHARWELRYARRALGLISAQHDALDDRTASLVARALSEALTHDPAIAPGKLRVAERQLNDRLRAYGEALAMRAGDVSGKVEGEGERPGWNLGRTLLAVAGRHDAAPKEMVARGAELLAGYLAEANEALRASFGAATLPDELAPRSAPDR